MEDPKVHLVKIRLCEACLAGEGQECHTPGCALWMHNSPGHPIIPEMYEIVRSNGTKRTNDTTRTLFNQKMYEKIYKS